MALSLQVAGFVAGLVALVLIARQGARGRSLPALPLTLAVAAQALRSLLALVIALDPRDAAGILPPGFASGAQAALAWFFLVSTGAYFLGELLEGLLPGRHGRGAAALYAFLAGLCLLLLARIWLGSPGAAGALKAPLWQLPYLLPQAYILLRSGGFLLRLGRRDLGPASPAGYAAACFMAAQPFDAVARLTALDAGLLPFLSLALFYGGIFLIIAAGRGPESAAPDPRGGELDAEGQRILSAILRGASNKEIAHAEGLSLSAVKHRVQAIYRALGVGSRFELMATFGAAKPERPRAAP